MIFDMHADVWTDNFWEYQKGNEDIIRKKYREKFWEGGLLGGIFVIYIDFRKTENIKKIFFGKSLCYEQRIALLKKFNSSCKKV